MAKRLTNEEFKLKLEKENPTVELLSEYNGNKNYITVRCKIDGNVWQTKPNWLKRGNRCAVCYHKINGEMNRNTLEYFIAKAREIHGNRYDYSKVVYINNKTKVCIICPEHGEFWQRPDKHLQGHGCTFCFTSYRKTTEEFIKKAREVHGDRYDYSKVEYGKNNREPVCIICPKHGEFWQSPDKHFRGCGCPICKYSSLEREVDLFLKEKQILFEPQKTFNWLGKQSLDFYLPEYNIAIECQGEQHFKGWWKSINKNDKQIIINRDIKKYNKCLEHNIKIIYYFDSSFNENDIIIYNTENTFNELEQLCGFFVDKDKKELQPYIEGAEKKGDFINEHNSKFDKFNKWLND